MSILFGHPTGTPFSHHAALAHFEAGTLESFCVPWMPSPTTLRLLRCIGPIGSMVDRLSRRNFSPLDAAPKTQGRIEEMRRLFVRGLGLGTEQLAVEANEWLMRTMIKECGRPRITAIHSYEDCSLWQFREAKRLGKACIYDMPIGYFGAWHRTNAALTGKYAEWMLDRTQPQLVDPRQKHAEMELADLVLAPSNFVADTIREFHPNKSIVLAPYGVDLANWSPPPERARSEIITFLFAGQCSVRKGVPLLIEAWRAAGLPRARLQLVGSWKLAASKKKALPPGCTWTGPVSSQQLTAYYQAADVFVLPTNFEGRALVVCEALASGLPVLTTYASGADDVVDDACGRMVPPDDFEALVEGLRWFGCNRDRLPELSRAARMNAERCNWDDYRRRVTEAVAPFV
jgi:glycosyltransferase involved in cell wall biosynthesis